MSPEISKNKEIIIDILGYFKLEVYQDGLDEMTNELAGALDAKDTLHQERLEKMIAEIKRLRIGLQTMLGPENDWEDGEVGVGYKFREIARKTLDG